METQSQLSQDDPGLFKQSLESINNLDKPYLGDYEAVSQLLRLLGTHILELDPPSETAITKAIYRVANILLGTDANYSAVQGWNREGSIDAFVQKITGSQDADPDDRIAVLLSSMISDLADIAALADQGGYLDEQLQEAVTGVYDHYTLVCMGIDPQGSEPVPEGRHLKRDSKLTRTQESILKRWNNYP